MGKQLVQRSATIGKCQGIEVTDPFYEECIPYRYSRRSEMADLRMRYKAREAVEDGFGYLDFALVIEPVAGGDSIAVDDNLVDIYAPANVTFKSYDIGMDSASVYIGEGGVCYGEILCTGTDGHFGDVYEARDGRRWRGIVLAGSVDSMFSTPEGLWEMLVTNFHAVEDSRCCIPDLR